MAMTEKTVTNEAATKEEGRLKRLKQCLVPAAVLSVLMFLAFKHMLPFLEILPDIIMPIWIVVHIAIAFYSGSIFYLFKVVLLPFRIMRGFGTLGFLIALFILGFWFPAVAWGYVFYPVIPLLVEWFILQKTMNEYENE